MLHLLFAAAISLQSPQHPGFHQLAAEHFAVWDVDHDGTLSPGEIDARCVDPAVKGDEAAAVAAIKRIVRSGKYALAPLTRDYLSAPAPKIAGGKPADAADTDRADAAETTRAVALKPPNFQASFSSSRRRIASSRRELFADPTPDLDKCRQGPLGDCYFVAGVGAWVHRDAEAVKRAVTARDDGGYDVQFADGATVALAPLTDAEIALSGTTGDEGLWLPVLEKALGRLRQQADPQKYATATATDAIAKGGSSAATLRLLTGHQTARIALKKRPRSKTKDAEGKPVALPPVAAADPALLADKVRAEVGAALAKGLLVTCGTGTEPQPPGINGKHAYAVLGFAREADTLTLWNPHGNTFRPKGAEGIACGYDTRAGVFAIPVADFVRVFSAVHLETAAPAKVDRH